VFINPYILEESNEIVSAEEGCLSIPNIRESVPRPNEIVLEYYDNDWNLVEQRFKGYAARVIQHEYDHVEGILFVEKISPLRKTLISRKLKEISIGKVDVDYKMIFPQKKRN
jgi:peptide deformylase